MKAGASFSLHPQPVFKRHKSGKVGISRGVSSATRCRERRIDAMVPNAHPADKGREEALSELEQAMVQAGLASYNATSTQTDTTLQTPAATRQQKLALLADTLQEARQLIAQLQKDDDAAPLKQNIGTAIEAVADHLDGAVDQLGNAKRQLDNLKRAIGKANESQ
jgi:acyl-CoA reductase-like NAD-dependent aldehyde dehydrogenase